MRDKSSRGAKTTPLLTPLQPSSGHGARGIVGSALVVIPVALLALAYFDTGNSLLWLSAAALVAVALLTERVRLRLPDVGIVLVLVYEIPSLANSRYAANGLPYAKVLCCAAVGYFLIRLSARTVSQVAMVSLAVATGGVALGWFALTQAGEHILGLQAMGFSDVVAFRWRLITPPAPWVAGEWFTLLLLTLPFALALSAFCRLRGRRALSAVAAAVAMPIVAALLLSCSRAVFWAVIVLLVSSLL